MGELRGWGVGQNRVDGKRPGKDGEKWVEKTGVGAPCVSPSSCATADFQFSAAYVCIVIMCSKPPLFLT